MDSEDRKRDRRLRGRAKRQGIVLKKSRRRVMTANDLGGWMLIDANTGFCLAGSRFDMFDDDVEKYLSEGDR